ncbi:MAG: Gfo/Idh/MocA family oxidoreductase [Candidatus Poribacteria bacterium]|nr:Gfo/Idh/MocA family oxidoreductase [Candidatus Poribacteria bacterium]
MAQYRAAVIGLGWMGMLYDLAPRSPDRFNIDDVDRPTPPLNIHRKFYHHDHPGEEGLPTSYAEAIWNRPDVELVAGADRDKKRLQVFSERYNIQALYTDAEEMLRQEKPDIVAVCTNTKYRADLTCLAVECGAKGIVTEKPMAHTLAEADRMVQTCAEAGVPLCCGAITTTHPSFARARALVQSGAIGEIVSMEASGPGAQHQNWSYFLNSSPAWVSGIGDVPRRESGSDEFTGQGIMVTADGLVVHFRRGAPGVRLSGTEGEISFDYQPGWKLWKEVDTPDGKGRVEMPWPNPQFVTPYGGVYCLADVMDCLAGTLDEPKNSGRRVAVALEVEVALKQSSAKGGERIELPLPDRSLGLHYDWFR